MSSILVDLPALLAVDPASLSNDDLVELWRANERLRNQLAMRDQLFIAAAEQRNLHVEFGARNVAALVRGLLRVEPREAVARVRAADAAAPHTSLTGEPVAAPFADVAAAQTSGDISPRHASVIVKAVDRLPDGVQASHGATVERDLVAAARTFDPYELNKLSLRMTTLLDQDGALADVAYRERHRDFSIRQRPDGSSTMIIEATAELTERVLVCLDALAGPKPAVDGVKDPRTAGMRRHDGLLDALNLVARAELLPDAGGVSTTVLLTMTTDSWNSGAGIAVSGHGAVLPVPEAIRIAGGDSRVLTTVLDEHGAIVGRTDARRFFTEKQRLAMAARDGGCSFPGCDTPSAWTEAHHVIPWIEGGPTTLDNGTLLCGYHHREHEKQGWRGIMIDNCPAWIPPPWIDTAQTPRRNPRPCLT